MKKNSAKFIYFALAFIAIISFFVLFITDFIIVLTSPNYLIRLIIFICSSVFLGLIVTLGISILNPVLSDAMITLRRILRFENLSNPLLLKLSSETPGTYHHCLNVSLLAQKAAKSIGADSLLVRTASYYHDIGKLENPLNYVENQAGGEVPTQEDAESIRRNAKLIISHVKSGIKIAKSNHLPNEIIDLITEHHGTSRALYFYGKAKERGLKIKKTDFRYDGPVPQSKESAILMLSDCVEATARASQSLTPDKITEIVLNTLEEKIGDNQIKNSSLNELELAKIKTSLEETLLSIYHQRIEYGKQYISFNN